MCAIDLSPACMHVKPVRIVMVCDCPACMFCSCSMYAAACIATITRAGVPIVLAWCLGWPAGLHGWVLTALQLLIVGIKGLRRRLHGVFLGVRKPAHTLCCEYASTSECTGMLVKASMLWVLLVACYAMERGGTTCHAGGGEGTLGMLCGCWVYMCICGMYQ
jgi:hypothetical protein